MDASDLNISNFSLPVESRLNSSKTSLHPRCGVLLLVVGDLVHQLAMGEAGCISKTLYSDDARNVYVSLRPFCRRWCSQESVDAFEFQQTQWQEEISRQTGNIPETNLTMGSHKVSPKWSLGRF